MQHHGDGLSITRRLFAHKLSLFFSLMLLLRPGQKHIVYQQSFFSYRTAVNSL